MGALLRIHAIIIMLQFASAPAAAQPTVTIQAQPIANASSVIVTFLQADPDSMQGCHYNLFAAKKAQDLKDIPGKGLSIATFKRDLPSVQIIAGPLRSLKRGDMGLLQHNSVEIYLRTLISCPDAVSSLSDIISFTVPTSKHGRLSTIKGLLRDMKYHMQYYNP